MVPLSPFCVPEEVKRAARAQKEFYEQERRRKLEELRRVEQQRAEESFANEQMTRPQVIISQHEQEPSEPIRSSSLHDDSRFNHAQVQSEGEKSWPDHGIDIQNLERQAEALRPVPAEKHDGSPMVVQERLQARFEAVLTEAEAKKRREEEEAIERERLAVEKLQAEQSTPISDQAVESKPKQNLERRQHEELLAAKKRGAEAAAYFMAKQALTKPYRMPKPSVSSGANARSSRRLRRTSYCEVPPSQLDALSTPGLKPDLTPDPGFVINALDGVPGYSHDVVAEIESSAVVDVDKSPTLQYLAEDPKGKLRAAAGTAAALKALITKAEALKADAIIKLRLHLPVSLDATLVEFSAKGVAVRLKFPTPETAGRQESHVRNQSRATVGNIPGPGFGGTASAPVRPLRLPDSAGSEPFMTSPVTPFHRGALFNTPQHNRPCSKTSDGDPDCDFRLATSGQSPAETVKKIVRPIPLRRVSHGHPGRLQRESSAGRPCNQASGQDSRGDYSSPVLKRVEALIYSPSGGGSHDFHLPAPPVFVQPCFQSDKSDFPGSDHAPGSTPAFSSPASSSHSKLLFHGEKSISTAQRTVLSPIDPSGSCSRSSSSEIPPIDQSAMTAALHKPPLVADDPEIPLHRSPGQSVAAFPGGHPGLSSPASSLQAVSDICEDRLDNSRRSVSRNRPAGPSALFPRPAESPPQFVQDRAASVSLSDDQSLSGRGPLMSRTPVRSLSLSSRNSVLTSGEKPKRRTPPVQLILSPSQAAGHQLGQSTASPRKAVAAISSPPLTPKVPSLREETVLSEDVEQSYFPDILRNEEAFSHSSLSPSPSSRGDSCSTSPQKKSPRLPPPPRLTLISSESSSQSGSASSSPRLASDRVGSIFSRLHASSRSSSRPRERYSAHLVPLPRPTPRETLLPMETPCEKLLPLPTPTEIPLPESPVFGRMFGSGKASHRNSWGSEKFEDIWVGDRWESPGRGMEGLKTPLMPTRISPEKKEVDVAIPACRTTTSLMEFDDLERQRERDKYQAGSSPQETPPWESMSKFIF